MSQQYIARTGKSWINIKASFFGSQGFLLLVNPLWPMPWKIICISKVSAPWYWMVITFVVGCARTSAFQMPTVRRISAASERWANCYWMPVYLLWPRSYHHSGKTGKLLVTWFHPGILLKSFVRHPWKHVKSVIPRDFTKRRVLEKSPNLQGYRHPTRNRRNRSL